MALVRMVMLNSINTDASKAQKAILARIMEEMFDDAGSWLAYNDGLSAIGGGTIDKEAIEVIIQETWESADDWFQPE